MQSRKIHTVESHYYDHRELLSSITAVYGTESASDSVRSWEVFPALWSHPTANTTRSQKWLKSGEPGSLGHALSTQHFYPCVALCCWKIPSAPGKNTGMGSVVPKSVENAFPMDEWAQRTFRKLDFLYQGHAAAVESRKWS